MNKALLSFLLLSAILILAACNLPGGETAAQTPTGGFETEVAMTLTAISQAGLQTPLSTISPVAPTDTLEPTVTFTATITPVPSHTFTSTNTQAPTETKAPTNTPIPKPGTIEGSISGYPYGSLPSLAIVAYKQEAPYSWSYWITAPGGTYFSMTSQYLLPGKWQVVAYDADNNSGGCPALVTVKSNETVSCDITDWSSTFPPKPASITEP